MGVVAAAELLELWERGVGRDALERDLCLLAFAQGQADAEALADCDLGLRDWHLLGLRRALFGDPIAAYTDCPNCSERLELLLDVRDLRSDAPPPAPAAYEASDGTRFRLPNTRDLLAVRGAADEAQAAQLLLQRCRVDSAPGGDAELDETLLEQVDRGLEALAAERGAQLLLSCAQCGHEWNLALDPGQLLWEELSARARAVINEVDCLAATYGWSETDILAMSEPRRAAYLERVR